MLYSLLRHFRSDTRGAAVIETVIIMPVLIWVYIGSFVFFDAFRTYSSAVRATYAIADVISRQTSTLRAFDMEGFARVFNAIVRNDGDVRMRMTQIYYDAHTNDLYVDWSYATNGEARLFTPNLDDFVGLLPNMTHAERLILVESFVPYRTSLGFEGEMMTFRNFTFTRPRSGQVPFS